MTMEGFFVMYASTRELLTIFLAYMQNKLTAAETELDVLKAMIAASRERDAFRVAYRHEGSLDETFAVTALRAQCWPRDMQEVFSR